jgi:hypothetical protein
MYPTDIGARPGTDVGAGRAAGGGALEPGCAGRGVGPFCGWGVDGGGGGV